MAIQIFGTTKCFETKKAERYFKEHRLAVQIVNIKEKPMSAGELDSVLSAVTKCVGSRSAAVELLVNSSAKAYAMFAYLDDDDKAEKLLSDQSLIKTPVVRNTERKEATVGYVPDVWKNWL